MKRTLSAIIVLCSFGGLLFAQRRNVHRSQEQVRIKKDLPTVYITFSHAGSREPLRAGESDQGIWLRLHNNTRWSIILEMNDVPKEYGDAGLFYDVISEKKVIREGLCHVCSYNGLGRGRSLLFSVPREYLANARVIRVSFNYGWEDPNDAFAGREPQHFVYFTSSNLPIIIQEGVK